MPTSSQSERYSPLQCLLDGAASDLLSLPSGGVTVSGAFTRLYEHHAPYFANLMVKCKTSVCARNIYSNFTFRTEKITTGWICRFTR